MAHKKVLTRASSAILCPNFPPLSNQYSCHLLKYVQTHDNNIEKHSQQPEARGFAGRSYSPMCVYVYARAHTHMHIYHISFNEFVLGKAMNVKPSLISHFRKAFKANGSLLEENRPLILTLVFRIP